MKHFPNWRAYEICQWSLINLNTNLVTHHYPLSRNIEHVLKESRNGFLIIIYLFLIYFAIL